MKTLLRASVFVSLAAAAAGCGWRRTPVPVYSETGSTALLVGEWSGDYFSRESGRSGSITFAMESEKDTAYCDVTMIPKERTFQITTHDRPEIGPGRSQTTPEPLRVRFIRLSGGKLSGTLDPYTDPECACRVTTTFDGQMIDGNTIKGTFTTRGSGLPRIYTGEWKVTRISERAGTQ
ncbi:MAG TPA: hypothetical protein VF042_08240 [Gemmatimonadaceae bacterium]